jgi:hypothetical protein
MPPPPSRAIDEQREANEETDAARARCVAVDHQSAGR